MLFATEIQEWLGSVDAVRATNERRRAMALRHEDDAVLSDIRRKLDSESVASAEDVIAVIRPLMERPDCLYGLLQENLQAALLDPFFLPPAPFVRHDVFSGLLLLQHPKVAIGLSVCGVYDLARKKLNDSVEKSIGFTGKHTMYNFLKAGDAQVSFWEAPVATDTSDMAANRCRVVDTRRLRDGDVLLVDGRSQSFIIEKASNSLVMLHADITLDAAPVQVEYSAKTLEYVGCSAEDGIASRIQLLASFLRIMDREDAIDAMKPYLQHQDFFVRWHVMRELLALDANQVLEELSAMAREDAREEVRQVAARTLARLVEMQQAPEASEAHA